MVSSNCLQLMLNGSSVLCDQDNKEIFFMLINILMNHNVSFN